jgi:hypothetical protein
VKKQKVDRVLSEDTKFVCHLERTTEKVSSWPTWKRNILGHARPKSENHQVSQKCQDK